MTNQNLGCGHCGRPLDLCDCGVDYEIAWRPDPVELPRAPSSPSWRFHYAPAILAHAVLVAAAVALVMLFSHKG